MTPGTHGKPVPTDGSLPRSAAKTPVELTDVLDGLDAPARAHLQVVLRELGDGLAGRGPDFNAAMAAAPGFTGHLYDVAGNLAAPPTGLRPLLDAADRTLAELTPVAPALGRIIANGARTANALAAARPQLGRTVAELPATEQSGVAALSVARPVLADADGLLRDLNRGSPYIVPAAARLHSALTAGIPALRHTTGLAGRLEGTLHAVRDLSIDPATSRTLERLLEVLKVQTPTLDFIAPMELQCNYIALWLRNVDSTISEGDNTGTWFRTLAVGATNEFTAAKQPAGTLHVNPYPHTAAPGQGGECEAGNEPYMPGQQLGNLPGDQGNTTEQP